MFGSKKRKARKKEIAEKLDKYYVEYNGEPKSEKPTKKSFGFLRNITKKGSFVIIAVLTAAGSLFGLDLVSIWNAPDANTAEMVGRGVMFLIFIITAAIGGNLRQEDSI